MRRISLSYCVKQRWNRCRMLRVHQHQTPAQACRRAASDAHLVWLASISPLTRFAVCTYGDLRESATCKKQWPHKALSAAGEEA